MQENHAVPDPDAARKRILVVEDNPSNLLYLCKVLTKAGYEPIQAQSASDAMTLLETEPVDLLLTDLMMPEVDGIELTRRVRQMPTFSTLPILMCTAAKDRSHVIEAAKYNIQGYILKPIDRDLLLERLAGILAAPPSLPEPV